MIKVRKNPGTTAFLVLFFLVDEHPTREALFSYSHNGSTTNPHPRRKQQKSPENRPRLHGEHRIADEHVISAQERGGNVADGIGPLRIVPA